MQAVMSVAAIQAAERNWADANGGTTWPLMERAGGAVAGHARRHWPRARRVWVLAGRGNNGGDGYVAASTLLAAGLGVELIAPSGEPRPGSDAHHAWQRFVGAGGTILGDCPDGEPDLVIDAVIGTGHQGELKARLRELFERVARSGAPVLAVDVPSGLEAATGRADPAVLAATRTLSFIAFKPGLLTGAGPGLSGRLSLEPLGIDAAASGLWSEGLGAYLNTGPAWPARPANSHKGDFGRVRVRAGATGMGGAGLLAARSALAAGAGRVIWHTDTRGAQAALAAQPELITAPLTASEADGIQLLGPGLGLDETADRLYRQGLESESGGVLDADGLTWLAGQPRAMPGWVLTPHPGEAARLLATDTASIQADRCQAALDLAERYQAVVILKGAGSLVAAEGRLYFVHPGTPAMATPGMGDTLTGLIAAFMAQGQTPLEAALTASWWHARLASDLAATGQRLVLATDLIRAIQEGPERTS